MNVLSTEAEIFAIRCGISQASQIYGVTSIVIIIDTIHAANYIFNTSIHPYQIYTITISSNLGKFFNKNDNNLISFWDCFSNDKWPSHLLVNKESKYHKMNPILFSKTLWKFSKKKECDSIVKK